MRNVTNEPSHWYLLVNSASPNKLSLATQSHRMCPMGRVFQTSRLVYNHHQFVSTHHQCSNPTLSDSWPCPGMCLRSMSEIISKSMTINRVRCRTSQSRWNGVLQYISLCSSATTTHHRLIFFYFYHPIPTGSLPAYLSRVISGLVIATCLMPVALTWLLCCSVCHCTPLCISQSVSQLVKSNLYTALTVASESDARVGTAEARCRVECSLSL